MDRVMERRWPRQGNEKDGEEVGRGAQGRHGDDHRGRAGLARTGAGGAFFASQQARRRRRPADGEAELAVEQGGEAAGLDGTSRNASINGSFVVNVTGDGYNRFLKFGWGFETTT